MPGGSRELFLHRAVVDHEVQLGGQLLRGPIVARHLEAVTGLVDTGGVVVAVPHIGHDDGRLAEVEAFRERVIAAVVDDGVDLRNDRRLREPALDDDIARHILVGVLVVADIDECAIGKLADRGNQSLEEIRIAGTERAERDVDERLVVILRKCRHLVGRFLAHAAFQILELFRRQRMRTVELDRLRIEQEVHVGRGLEELADRIGGLTRRGEEGVEIVVDRLDHLVEAIAESLLAHIVILAAAGEMRRDLGILDLVFRAGDDAHPRLAEMLDRREEDDIVDADEIRLDPGKHTGQILLGPLGAFDDRLPAILHVVVDLVIGRLPEIWNVTVDEIFPELRHLFRRHGLGQIDGMGLEAITLIDRDEAGIGEEDNIMAQSLHGLGNANRVEGRPEGGFREKCDGLCHGVPFLVRFVLVRIGRRYRLRRQTRGIWRH